MVDCNICVNKGKRCSDCINNFDERKDNFCAVKETEAEVYRLLFSDTNEENEERLYIVKNGISIELRGGEVNNIRKVCNEKMNWMLGGN